MVDNPAKTLGLPAHADANQVRKRYLELVREFPPESEPERFAEIRAAYEALSDPVKRLETELFNYEGPSMKRLIGSVEARARARRLPTELLLSIARDSR